MPRLRSLLAAALLALPALLAAQEEEEIKEREAAITPTPEALDTVAMPQALKARSIGPAVMGGESRISRSTRGIRTSSTSVSAPAG